MDSLRTASPVRTPGLARSPPAISSARWIDFQRPSVAGAASRISQPADLEDVHLDQTDCAGFARTVTTRKRKATTAPPRSGEHAAHDHTGVHLPTRNDRENYGANAIWFVEETIRRSFGSAEESFTKTIRITTSSTSLAIGHASAGFSALHTQLFRSKQRSRIGVDDAGCVERSSLTAFTWIT